MTIFELINALEIKTSTVFNLFLSNNIHSNNILLSFFLFLIIDLNLLIIAVAAQIFILIAKPTIPTGIITKKAKAEIEMQTITVEAKITKCSIVLQI